MFVVKMPTAKIQWALTFVLANLDTPNMTGCLGKGNVNYFFH